MNGLHDLSPEEQPLLDAVLAAPDDDALRLVYADWLEERGDERADYLWAEIAFLRVDPDDEEALRLAWRELCDTRRGLDDDWVARVTRILVENCPNDDPETGYDFDCPRRWERMGLRGDADVRVCEACERQVLFCTTVEKARVLRDAGQVVAVDPTNLRTMSNVFDELNPRYRQRLFPDPRRDRSHKPVHPLSYVRHPRAE